MDVKLPGDLHESTFAPTPKLFLSLEISSPNARVSTLGLLTDAGDSPCLMNRQSFQNRIASAPLSDV